MSDLLNRMPFSVMVGPDLTRMVTFCIIRDANAALPVDSRTDCPIPGLPTPASAMVLITPAIMAVTPPLENERMVDIRPAPPVLR